MKLIPLFAFLFFLGACTGHHDAGEFNLVKLKEAVAPLFHVPTNGNRIEKQRWPSEIKELDPQSVFKSEQGIYIKLDSFFVEESGLFIPTPGTLFDPGMHSDPGYISLGEGIYSYLVSG